METCSARFEDIQGIYFLGCIRLYNGYPLCIILCTVWTLIRESSCPIGLLRIVFQCDELKISPKYPNSSLLSISHLTTGCWKGRRSSFWDNQLQVGVAGWYVIFIILFCKLRYWQEIYYPRNTNFGSKFDDITTFCWSGIVKIYFHSQVNVFIGAQNVIMRSKKPRAV